MVIKCIHLHWNLDNHLEDDFLMDGLQSIRLHNVWRPHSKSIGRWQLWLVWQEISLKDKKNVCKKCWYPAGDQQFLFFPQWVHKAFSLGCCRSLILSKQALAFMCLQYKSFENAVGIIPFPTVVSTLLENFLPFYQIYNCYLQTLSASKRLKFVIWERLKGKPETYRYQCSAN